MSAALSAVMPQGTFCAKHALRMVWILAPPQASFSRHPDIETGLNLCPGKLRRRFVDHADGEAVQSVKIHRPVLHLQIHIINIGAGQGASLSSDRSPVCTPMNGFPAASFSITGLRCLDTWAKSKRR